jgi:hypothetical protein
MRFSILLSLALIATAGAADRHWQGGKWTSVTSKRQMVDFGPGSSPFGNSSGRPSTPAMKALVDVRLYVIETDDLRLELEDTVKVDQRSIDAVAGLPVTFALEKNTVYVKDAGGVEHKLKVTKKVNKSR